MKNKTNMHFYESKERYRIVVDDELLDLLAEEFLSREANVKGSETFLQWVEFRTWEMSNKFA